MMYVLNEEGTPLGSAAGVCDRAGQAGITSAERVLGGGEQGFAGAVAVQAALVRPERATLAEIGRRLGRKALANVACVAKPDTILGWYRRLVAAKFVGSKRRSYPGASSALDFPRAIAVSYKKPM